MEIKMEKERKIYCKNLIVYVLRKWRSILIWMLIFSVALNGLAIMKSYKAMRNSQQYSNEENVSSYAEGLTDDSKEKVEETYKLYVNYQKTLSDLLNYYSNSIKMQIDPNNVAVTSIQYRIENPQKTDDIILAYSNKILSSNSCEKIKENIGLKEDANYINELIEVKRELENNKEDTVNLTNKDSSVMLIQIIAPDQGYSEKIADVIESEINEYTEEVQSTIGKFELTKIGRNFSGCVDSELMEEQNEFVTNINSVKNAIDLLENSLDANEQTYFKKLINAEEEKVTVTESDGNTVKVISIKYIILGLIVGGFLCVFWYMIKYLLSIYLKTDQEIEDYYEVQVLEKFDSVERVRENKNVIDRFINGLFGKKNDKSELDKIQLVCTKIIVLARKNNMTHIHVTGISKSEDVENIKKLLVDNLIKENILTVSSGVSIIDNVESLKYLSQSEGVILVEQVGKVLFEDLGKEINICSRNNVEVIGAIVVE